MNTTKSDAQVSVDPSEQIQLFIDKFSAQVVIPFDGKTAQVDIGPNRIAISKTVSKLPPGTDLLIRFKNLKSILLRDVWDVTSLLGAELIERQITRSAPEGVFRPVRQKPLIIYPTGILAVDSALYVGGFLGRVMSRIWGPSTGGKSVILQMAMITAWRIHKKKSLLINPEYDFDEARLEILPGGADALDADAIEVYEPGTGVDAYDKALDLIATGDYGVVGFDSITPLRNPDDLAKSLGASDKVALKAEMQSRFIEKILPILYHQSRSALILVVQGRVDVATGHRQSYGMFDSVSGSYIPGGGKPASAAAIQFYAQQSILVNAPQKVVYDGDKNIVAHLVTGIVDKNKHAPQGRKFEFPVNYYTGLATIDDMIAAAVKARVIMLEKRLHIVSPDVFPPDGVTFTNNKDCRQAIVDNPDLYRALYVAILHTVNPKMGL